MKRLVLSLLIISSLPAHAGLRLGGLLGYRVNTLTTDTAGVSYKNSGGYQVGGLLWYSMLDVLSLRTGLLHTVKDTKGTVLGNDVTVKLSYWDIPLNLEVSPPGIDLYIFGGLKLGLLSSSGCEAAGGFTCSTRIKSTNSMMNLGVGYFFDLAGFHLGGEIEYEKGMMNISETSDDLRTSALNFNAVASFPL